MSDTPTREPEPGDFVSASLPDRAQTAVAGILLPHDGEPGWLVRDEHRHVHRVIADSVRTIVPASEVPRV